MPCDKDRLGRLSESAGLNMSKAWAGPKSGDAVNSGRDCRPRAPNVLLGLRRANVREPATLFTAALCRSLIALEGQSPRNVSTSPRRKACSEADCSSVQGASSESLFWESSDEDDGDALTLGDEPALQVKAGEAGHL